MQPQLSIDSDNAHNANEGFGPYPDNALPYAVVNDDGGYNVRIFGEWDKNIIEITVKRLNSDGSSTTNKVAGLIGTLLDDGTYKYCLSWAFINPAEYAVTLSLKDKTNFTWHDGTSEDATFIFEIKDKKPIPAPTAHLRDSATDTEDVDFATFDGAAHAIDFTDFTENAVYTTVNGESVYAITETDNRAYYLLESETIAENIDSAGEWVVNVALAPAPEYTWADGSVTSVEYTCKINAYTTFFPGIKVANAYTALDPENPTADDAEVMRLMNDWFGAGGAGKMETDCRNYNAAVYFYASQDDNKAKYVGTVENTHAADNFGTYSMSFALTDIADKSAPTHYHGATKVEAGSKVDSTICPNDDPFSSVDKITDYDMPFFLIAKVDCREAVQSENITYAYATVGDCTVVKIKGDNGGDGVNSEKVTSEVYLVFRGGEYVGHEINTTVKIGEVNTTPLHGECRNRQKNRTPQTRGSFLCMVQGNPRQLPRQSAYETVYQLPDTYQYADARQRNQGRYDIFVHESAARGRSAEGTGEGESERAGEGAYVVAGGGDARDLHGFRLLLGGIGVGIGVGVDPEEEGEEGVDKAPSVLIRRGGEVRREAAAHGIEGAVIDALELHKVLEPAAVLDVVEVHGHEFQHTAAPSEYVRKPRSEILRGEGGTLGERVKILAPGGVFPLQQREEDLLLGAEIVVYGRAREGRLGRLRADRAQGYVLERECGI